MPYSTLVSPFTYKVIKQDFLPERVTKYRQMVMHIIEGVWHFTSFLEGVMSQILA